VDLSDVVVVDDNGTPADTSDDFTCRIGDLAVGAVETCSQSGTAEAGQYGNIATATGLADVTLPVPVSVTDSDASHYLGLAGSLTVEKQVVWNRAPVQEDRTFEICVSGPSFDSPACRQFQDGDSYTWTGLVPGAYSVTETPWTGDPLTWVVEVVYEPAGAEVATVVAGGEAKVVVINTTDVESPPTAVALESWQVQGGAGTVSHTFTTAFEKGTLSFRLYRGESLAGAELVGEVGARGAASTYEIQDRGLEAGRYLYWLVEVQEDGAHRLPAADAKALT
ncbi:MAG: hypothetical protein ACOYEW_13145, partial [Anaerolineae bacterium]|jgi:hypothetical protein